MVVSEATLAIAISLLVTSPLSLTKTLIVTIASSSSNFKVCKDLVRAYALPCTSALTTTHISRLSLNLPSAEKVAATLCMSTAWYEPNDTDRSTRTSFFQSCLPIRRNECLDSSGSRPCNEYIADLDSPVLQRGRYNSTEPLQNLSFDDRSLCLSIRIHL